MPGADSHALAKNITNRHAERLLPVYSLALVLIFSMSVITVDCTAIVDREEPILDDRAQSFHPSTALGNDTELEAFFDALILTQLQDLHIAGVTVAVEDNGSVLLTNA